MRLQGEGLIINISSIAGLISLPYHGAYCASKYALESFTESMRIELIGSGVKVVSLSPGDVATNATSNKYKVDPSNIDIFYKKKYGKAAGKTETEVSKGIPPKVVAQSIHKIILKKNPQVRYQVGKFFQTLAPKGKRILPYNIFEQILIRYYS